MNYFTELTLQEKHQQLSNVAIIKRNEFNNGVNILKGKKIVVVGCGSQGLAQGLNLRESGLDVSYALRKESIEQKRQSFLNAKKNDFVVDTYKVLIPLADVVINLTPDKQHTSVINTIMPLMKKDSILSYSHGFNIIEESTKIREDITVILVAPKGPGTEVRVEYSKGFGVPTLIAVHTENDPRGKGLEYAKAYAVALGAHTAGVLRATFSSEVKSDLMGEQTVLCGLLQSGTILAFNRLVIQGVNEDYACKFVQKGWENITEALKHGGITNMMDRLSNKAKIKANKISLELKKLLKNLFEKHMDDIITGKFAETMMADWKNNDKDLLKWREETGETAFEQATQTTETINTQEYFDVGLLMVALIKAGVELAFETMIKTGFAPEIAYYESLHELPLISNLISRKKLYEMNKVISDTAEYGCYLFDQNGRNILAPIFNNASLEILGKKFNEITPDNVDNKELININNDIQSHPIEIVGRKLRSYMTSMKTLASS